RDRAGLRCIQSWEARTCAFSDAGDFHHSVHLGKRLHHALELIEVGTVEREDVARSPVVARATVRFADADALRAERLADDRENSGLVRGRHAELNRAVDLRPRVPLHVDAPLGLGIEGPLTLAPVNRDATSARDEADDPVARQRIATLR